MGLITNMLLITIVVILYLLEKAFIHNCIISFIKWFRQLNRFSIFLFICFFALGLVNAVYQPNHYDDGLYYQPYIKWLCEYPVIAGLGNLHSRFAFNSNWHILNATFSFSFILDNSFHHLNPLLLILVSGYAIEGIDKIVKKNYQYVDLLKACLVAPHFLFLDNISSPAPDVPVFYLSLIVFILLVNKTIFPARLPDNLSLIICIISTYLLTIKLSSIFIFLSAPVLIFVIDKITLKQKIFFSAIVITILLPWLSRNYYLSGFLLYPFDALDIFNVDWKMPKQILINESKWVESSAKLVEISELSGWSINWVPNWFEHLGLFDRFMICMVPLGWSAFLYNKANTYKILLLFLLITGLAFWFIKAPAPRFGYAFIIFPFFLLLTSVFDRLKQKSIYLTHLFIAFLGLMQIPSFIGFGAIQGHFITFPSYKTIIVNTVNCCNNSFINTFPQSGDQCFKSKLPCASYNNSNLKLRGSDIKNGFSSCQK